MYHWLRFRFRFLTESAYKTYIEDAQSVGIIGQKVLFEKKYSVI